MHQDRQRWIATLLVAGALSPFCTNAAGGSTTDEEGSATDGGGADTVDTPEPGCSNAPPGSGAGSADSGTDSGGGSTGGAGGSAGTPSGGSSAGGATGSAGAPSGGAGGSGSAGSSATGGVKLKLERSFTGTGVISFGVPLAPGALNDVSSVEVRAAGLRVPARVRELLAHRNASGARTSAASIGIQLESGAIAADTLDVEVVFKGNPLPLSGETVAFADARVSASSAATATTTVRNIASVGGVYKLTEAAPVQKTIFVGREPKVLVHFPDGYLAATGILGMQTTAESIPGSNVPAMKFLSDAFGDFALSSMYADGYAYNPHAESTVDLVQDYSAWLYDRCATYLTAYSHFGDTRFLRHAYRSCAYYGSKIGTSGTEAGIFTGKAYPDTKYSHARGIYAYYALTGDETALAAGKAVAKMWLDDPLFVTPYRQGHLRGPDKLWTERLLATSLEGLLYGYFLTGEMPYLDAVRELVTTTHKHITGDASALAEINPGVNFPPQNCLVHNASQQAEGDLTQPWCSPWMSELMVDALVQYQNVTNDSRVDEIFVRLGRFLRDVGTSYFTKDPFDDTFLAPSVCDNPADGEHRRRLVPLYGAALDASGKRRNYGEWTDIEHCSDATALTAAALRGLVRRGEYAKNPVGPFASEGASFLALHQELASCAERTFQYQTRPNRDPSNWTSAELAQGISDPAAFIQAQKIGFPVHVQMPQRKLSWWFNTSMLGFRLLADAGVSLQALETGKVQPKSCQ